MDVSAHKFLFFFLITEAQKVLNVLFFSNPHSWQHLMSIFYTSGSSSLRRNFRQLAPPENNFLLLFKSVFCFFANHSNRLRRVGVIAGQSEGTYFSLIFSQKRHLAQRRKVFPGSASFISFRFILSVCVLVHTEHIWSSINTCIPRRTEACSCKMMKWCIQDHYHLSAKFPGLVLNLILGSRLQVWSVNTRLWLINWSETGTKLLRMLTLTGFSGPNSSCSAPVCK